MRREQAEQAIQQWVQSNLFKAALSDDEYSVLLTDLMGRNSSATPLVVNNCLQRLFPQHPNFTGTGEENMQTSRVVPPRKPQAAQQPQTAVELEAVMQAYINTGHFAAVAPNSAPPWAFNNGVMYVGSRANLALIKAKLKEMGVQRIRVADLHDVVNVLALAGVFERVVEQPAPPPPKPSERDLHNRQVKIDRAMNHRETSPIRGAKEAAKPLLKPIDNSNVAEAAASEKAARENAIVNEALSRINTFTGHSHSRTASGRAHLRAVFQAAMDAGQPAEAVLQAVEAEADRLAGNSSIR